MHVVRVTVQWFSLTCGGVPYVQNATRAACNDAVATQIDARDAAILIPQRANHNAFRDVPQKDPTPLRTSNIPTLEAEANDCRVVRL